MKKVVALLMAAVMTVGMATVAFAAPSPAATTGTVKEAVDAKGKSIELVASDNYAKADQAAAAEIKSDAQAVLKKVVPSVNAADYDYPGIRMMLEATLDHMRQPIKIDISTDDVITPRAIQYEYKLMFEDRSISVLTYNIETLLAEKMQTILVRGIANTRMRDFYDVYEILKVNSVQVDEEVLKRAFEATCVKRNTILNKIIIKNVLVDIGKDVGLQELWGRFRDKYYFVQDLEWDGVCTFVVNEIETLLVSEN